KRIGAQLMAVVCEQDSGSGKTYVPASALLDHCFALAESIVPRIEALSSRSRLTPPKETINPLRPSPRTPGASGVTRHGLSSWGDLFTPRQMLCLLNLACAVREAERQLSQHGYEEGRTVAVLSNLALLVDRQADYNSTLCSWHNTRELIGHTY